jgi:predicted DNA-binding protein
VGSNDAHINLRLPSGLLQALDAWATALGATRSAVLRGLIEDAADATELPTLSPTHQEQLDVELERLRELSRS